MSPAILEQLQAEIIDRISREASGNMRRFPLLLVLRGAGALLVLYSLALFLVVTTVQPLPVNEVPLVTVFDAPEPPARALEVLDRPAGGSTPRTPAALRAHSSSAFESAEFSVLETSDGSTQITQLRISAEDPSLQIHWIIN